MNFKIINNIIYNNCDGGKCCLNCKYKTSDPNGNYKACSDSCMRCKEIFNIYSCKNCKHNKEK